jgi:hypothetical protein
MHLLLQRVNLWLCREYVVEGVVVNDLVGSRFRSGMVVSVVPPFD